MCSNLLYEEGSGRVDFVDSFFNVEKFIGTHQRFGLLPSNGPNMWPKGSGALVFTSTF